MSSKSVKEVSSRQLGRIYYVLDFLKKAKIAETVNACVPNNKYCVDVEGRGLVGFTVGQLLEIMVINRLYGLKTPIYHIGEWCQSTAIPEIYGIPAKLLHDDCIGGFLDKIYPYLATIDSHITMNIIRAFDIEVSQIHFDASSFKVYGERLATAGQRPAIKMTYGRNGRGQMDDKLVRFGIAITKEDAFPLLAKGYSGNTNDSEMHPEFLLALRNILGTTDFIFAADTKLDTKANLSDIMDKKGFFLCPGAMIQSLQKIFIEEYRQKYKFKRLEYASKKERKKPKGKREYFEAFETEETMVVKERGQKARTYRYRLLFVYSSAKGKAEAKSRQKGIAKVQKELYYLASRLNKQGCKTRQQALAKLGEILKRAWSKFFNVELNEQNGLLSLAYSLKQHALDEAKILDGIYVLKTNLPESKYSLDAVLSLYKKQGQIEERIAALKGPLEVAPIYLKKPERILSLFTIIVQALKIYTLIEREVHQAVAERGHAIPILPENRFSEKPKASSILRIFDDHLVSLVSVTFSNGSCQTYLSSLSDKQKMLFEFVKRKAPDRRTFSRKIGVTQIHTPSG